MPHCSYCGRKITHPIPFRRSGLCPACVREHHPEHISRQQYQRSPSVSVQSKVSRKTLEALRELMIRRKEKSLAGMIRRILRESVKDQ